MNHLSPEPWSLESIVRTQSGAPLCHPFGPNPDLLYHLYYSLNLLRGDLLPVPTYEVGYVVGLHRVRCLYQSSYR